MYTVLQYYILYTTILYVELCVYIHIHIHIYIYMLGCRNVSNLAVKHFLDHPILSFGRKQGWILHFTVPLAMFIDAEADEFQCLPKKKRKILK